MFLGVEPDGVPVFAVDAPLPALPGTRRGQPARGRPPARPTGTPACFTTALALANWHARHGYSPATGQPHRGRTRPAGPGWTADGGRMWPRTDPAMIVLVHDGVAGPDGPLPARQQRRLAGHAGRRGATPAWPGTSSRASRPRPPCCARSARRSASRVERIGYVGSQAWPFPGSLMLGFLAMADPAEPVRVDPTEIAHARWFTRRRDRRGAGRAGRGRRAMGPG